jgi:2'-5' RNA ligase
MNKIVNDAVNRYKICEYLLIISPPEELWNKIAEVKRSFYYNYRADTALWAKPHITLVKFLQFEKTEERIVNRLYQIAKGYYPVKVELENYGSFPNHTIYINIRDKLPIQNLVKQIRSEARYLLKLNGEFKPHFIIESHLSIAHKLLLWQYEVA